MFLYYSPQEKPNDEESSSNGKENVPISSSEPELTEIPKTVLPEADQEKPAVDQKSNTTQALQTEELAEVRMT